MYAVIYYKKITYPCRRWSKKIPCDLGCSRTSSQWAAFQCSGLSLCLQSLVGLHLSPDASQPGNRNTSFQFNRENLQHLTERSWKIQRITDENQKSYLCLNTYNKKLKSQAMTINTLITPWSLLSVTSMPLAANTAVADWPSIGRSWSLVIFCVWASHGNTVNIYLKQHKPTC